MADLYTTDPSECFAQSPFGFGPFPWNGDVVIDCPAYPEGTGFGGVGWVENPYTAPPGGLPYGLGPYGSALFPSVPMQTDLGGFGSDPYGLGPYGGSVDSSVPSVTAVVNVSNWEVEVYFSTEMDIADSRLTAVSSYTLTPVSMAADSFAEEVTVHLIGSEGGALSVIVRHSGTTLGGAYTLQAEHATSIYGIPLSGNSVAFLARGGAPDFSVTPINGDTLQYDFSHPLIPPGSVGGSGVDDLTSYAFETDEGFPVIATPVSVESYSTSEVVLKVQGMTSLPYRAIVGPATALGYDGTVLPSASPDCVGTVLFPANGTSVVVGGHLNLGRISGTAYGWDFRETGTKPGTLTTDSTFRVDWVFDAQQGQYSPPLSSFAHVVLAEFIIEDGPETVGTRITVQLVMDSGTPLVTLRNDALSISVPGAWDTDTCKVSIVRNMLSGACTVLLDDEPIISTPITNLHPTAEDGPCVRVLFPADAFSISGFQLHSVGLSASQTIFSEAWNFFHDVPSDFTGSDALTGEYVPTQRGPLVKDWGDATPATAQDVVLRVNGIEVEVASVNPYVGKIYPKYPIPLMPSGSIQVDVDYKWLATPIMGLTGLNTEGLVLNKWDRASGHHNPAGHGEQIQTLSHPKGAPDTHRFPLAVVLGPVSNPQPLLIGHRYMGFERAYSALLNSPTSLRLNQSPYQSETDAFERTVTGESVSCDGTRDPTTADPVWALSGVDSGAPNVGLGTYTVHDARTGSYDPTDPQIAVYARDVDFSFPSAISVNARFTINDYQAEGVFTGVGFGFHNNHEMYVVGALDVGGLEHIGILSDASRPDLLGSWIIGPQVQGTITSRNIVSVPSEDIPSGLSVGERFQILTGTQKGIYSIKSVTSQCNGVTILSLNESFPADFGLWGNNYPTIYFETPWSDQVSTYRLTVNLTTKSALLETSGRNTTRIVALDGTQNLPSPSEFLFLDLDKEGQVFWGSLSAPATNRSTWSFLQYGVVPDRTLLRGHAVVVTTEMDVLPDVNSDEWGRDGNFGYAESSSSEVLLKSDVASDTLKFTFGYERLEPFFVQDAYLDLRAKFKVDSGILGAGDASIILNDGVREVCLATIQYIEGWGGAEYRRIVRQPSISMAGFLTPNNQNWTLVGGSTGAATPQEDDLVVTQTAGQEILYQAHLDVSGVPVSGDRIIESRFAVQSYVGRIDGTTGICFGGDFATNFGPDRAVILRLKGGTVPSIQLLAGDDTLVQEYPFMWDDGEFHSYRIVTSQGTVSLYLDDGLQLPTLAATSFPGGTATEKVFFGALRTLDGVVESGVASIVRWRSVSYTQIPIQAVKRTLGVWRGGDKNHINSWELPRTDASSTPNSAQIGPVIQQMDWRQPMTLRVLRSPGWGVSVFRPDMAMPPYYNGHYATEVDVPSAAWINVEYADLPTQINPFGYVSFGALDSRSITQQRWDYIRYRLYKVPTEDYIAPQGMVLNQFNIITSGEPLKAVGYENVSIVSLDNRRVCLLPTHIYAGSIWKVVDGSTIYTSESFTFDRESQTITLGTDAEGNPLYFSGAHVPLTVVFIPGKPYTNTYLQKQALLNSMTLLNEGTPPVPKSQCASAVAQIVRGDGTEGPDGAGGSIGYDFRKFEAGSDAIYEDLEFFNVDNGGEEGLIHSICEGTLPQGESGFIQETLPIGEPIYSTTGTGPFLGGVGASAGLRETGTYVGVTSGSFAIEFKGAEFWEEFHTPVQPDFEPVLEHALYMSGGSYLKPVVDGSGNIIGEEPAGGVLGVAILYPQQPSMRW